VRSAVPVPVFARVPLSAPLDRTKSTPIIPPVPTVHQNEGGPLGKLDCKAAAMAGCNRGIALPRARRFADRAPVSSSPAAGKRSRIGRSPGSATRP
jgi:hypothetical protein